MVPWAAALLACSRLLEGAGGPYFGSARSYVSLLTLATKHIINVSLCTLSVSFKKFFVLELQWILLVFAFWPHQKTDFEAFERNKDSSHAPTAHKLTLDAPHTIRVAAFLARASPNRFLNTKRGEEERGERENKRRNWRERRKGEEAPANSPP